VAWFDCAEAFMEERTYGDSGDGQYTGNEREFGRQTYRRRWRWLELFFFWDL